MDAVTRLHQKLEEFRNSDEGRRRAAIAEDMRVEELRLATIMELPVEKYKKPEFDIPVYIDTAGRYTRRPRKLPPLKSMLEVAKVTHFDYSKLEPAPPSPYRKKLIACIARGLVLKEVVEVFAPIGQQQLFLVLQQEGLHFPDIH